MKDFPKQFEKLLAGELSLEEEAVLGARCFDAMTLLDRHEQLALQMQAANGDELNVLVALRDYLSETGIPAWITMPIWLRIAQLRSKQFRKTSASISEQKLMPMTVLAAAVSAYKLLGLRTVKDAAQHVADISGVDAKEILDFRENTTRAGNKSVRKAAFDAMLRSLKAIPPDIFEAEVFHRVAQLAALPRDIDKP